MACIFVKDMISKFGRLIFFISFLAFSLLFSPPWHDETLAADPGYPTALLHLGILNTVWKTVVLRSQAY